MVHLMTVGATTLAIAHLLAGCSSLGFVGEPTNPRLYPLNSSIPKGGGKRFVGRPHYTNGRWFTPRHEPNYDRTGTVTWYGASFRGRKTANGEIFDHQRLTMAHPTLPLPSYVEVTNLENGRRLILRANDRGPFIKNRLADISERAATYLGFRKQGTAQARVRYLRPAPLDGNDTIEENFARQQMNGPRLVATYNGG
jgi:rare lipoprotein A